MKLPIRISLRHQRLGSLDQTALEALQFIAACFLHEVLFVYYLLVEQHDSSPDCDQGECVSSERTDRDTSVVPSRC